eukprot:SAG22_NODE_173_length_16589_cov_120.738933_13_plen_135_part_00
MAATHRVVATTAEPAGVEQRQPAAAAAAVPEAEASSNRRRLSIGFFYNPSFDAVVTPVAALPAGLTEAAAANRAVRDAAAKAGEGRDLYGESAREYGYNALSGYMRSLPHIFEAHHPDLLPVPPPPPTTTKSAL